MKLEQAIGNRLNYYKRHRNIIKAHQTKASLISLRKDWLDRQKASNYQNEYDRVRSLVNQSSTANHTPLHERKKKLEGLGAKIADHIV